MKAGTIVPTESAADGTFNDLNKQSQSVMYQTAQNKRLGAKSEMTNSIENLHN